MTHYTVVWVQSTEAELVDLWLEADDRGAITAAANTIDHELRIDAELKGVELSEGLRALNVAPLRVIFTARLKDRVAEILRVRRV